MGKIGWLRDEKVEEKKDEERKRIWKSILQMVVIEIVAAYN